MKHYIKHILRWMACAVCCFAVASCQDDTFRDFYPNEDGSVDVTFTVDMPPLQTAEMSSRGTAGDAIKEFDENSLHIFVYNEDGTTLIYDCGKEGLTDYEYNKDGNTTSPSYPYGEGGDKYQTSSGESATPRATFKFKVSPFVNGETYQIYVTANVTFTDKTEYETADKLKAYRVFWDNDPQNTAKNNQMFGMFALNNSSVEGENITIGSSRSYNIHAWLVRCVSKVTISFDTTELNDNTWIYLHNVRIHNVPKNCPLGNGNIATEDNLPEPDGDMIMYAPAGSNYDNADSEFSNWPTLTRGTMYYPMDATDSHEHPELHKVHSETAEALFFYENLQGTGKSKSQVDPDKEGGTPDGEVSYPGSVDEDHPQWRDEKPFGTFIEVEAYYRSTTKGNEGMGKIIYRFQLGMDADKDYNAYRNHHFKLIMAFKGNANDVDWHIEYNPNTDNPIYVPHPFYISYLYGEEVEIPITINGRLSDGHNIIAEIVENNWKPQDAPSNVYWTGDVWSGPNHKYDGPWHGFLSLRSSNALSNTSNNDSEVPNSDAIGRDKDKNKNLSIADRDNDRAYLMSYWYGGVENMQGLQTDPAPTPQNFYTKKELRDNENMYIPMQGYREYEINNRNGVNDDFTEDNPDHYDIIEVKYGGDSGKTKTHVYLPLYTRALFMVKTMGFSGANPYFFYQRKAVVKLTCWIDEDDGKGGTVAKEYSKLCDVIQVRRIINPCGIYREAGNNKSFTVNLSFRTSENSTTFMPFASEGKWSAEIESGDPGFITLNGQQKVFGRTGELVKFQVHFIPTTSSKNRYAVILVKYHDYTCKHRIIVRQGYDPDQVVDKNLSGRPAVYWHCFNLRGAEKEAESPLEAGSMFRWGNLDYAIDDINNENAAIGSINSDGYYVAGRDGKILPQKVKWYLRNQNPPLPDLDPKTPNLSFQDPNPDKYNESNFRTYFTLKDENGKVTNSGKRTRLARMREWKTLREDPRLVYTYGICYDGNSTGTSFTSNNAFNYSASNPDKTGSGMRGVFLFNQDDGRNIFFPIGVTGHGRRKHGQPSGSTDDAAGTLRYASRSFYMPTDIVERWPMFWNIRDNLGAIYWGYPDHNQRKDAWDGKDLNGFTAWDINFSTYDFNQFGQNALPSSTSANNAAKRSGTGNYYFSDAAYMRLVDVPDGSDDSDAD